MLHRALLAGTILAVVILAVVSGSITGPPPAGAEWTWLLRLLAVGLFLVLAVGTTVVARSLPRVESADSWWRTYGGRVLALWFLAEGVTVAGAVLYVITGVVLMMLPVAAGIATLVVQRPSRIVES